MRYFVKGEKSWGNETSQVKKKKIKQALFYDEVNYRATNYGFD